MKEYNITWQHVSSWRGTAIELEEVEPGVFKPFEDEWLELFTAMSRARFPAYRLIPTVDKLWLSKYGMALGLDPDEVLDKLNPYRYE